MLSTIATYVWILYAVAMVQTFSHALYFMSAIFAALLTYSYLKFYTSHALKKQIARGKVAPESAYFKVKSAKLAAGCAYAVIGIYLLGLVSSAVKNGVSPSDLSSKDSQIVLIISMLLLIGVVAAEIYRTVNRRNTPQEAQPEPEQPPTPQEAAGQRCPHCGEPALPENTFCGSCGTALRPPAPQHEGRQLEEERRWEMMRRQNNKERAIALVVVAVFLFLSPVLSNLCDLYLDTYYSLSGIDRASSGSSSSSSKNNTSSQTKTPATTQQETPKTGIAAIEPAINKPISLSGNGDMVIKDVECSADAYVDVTHDGEHNIVVRAYYYDQDSNLLVNEIGTYSGRVYLGNAGRYTLEIQADGNWTISGGNIVTTDKTSYSGTGDFVTPYFDLPKKDWKITHDGEHYFSVIVHSYDSDRDLLASEIGNYSGTVRTDISVGDAVFFEITADGSWTIAPQ